MAPAGFFVAAVVDVDVDRVPLLVLVTFLEEGDDVVIVGLLLAVEDGERSLRQVLSFDNPTVFMSELPP
jgi:hypothetical protein